MKRLLILAGLIFLGFHTSKVHAQGVFDVGYSSYAVTGAACATGTVVNQMNSTRPSGFGAKVVGYRLQNQDATYAVWLGGSSVSTNVVTDLGVKVISGDSITFMLGNQPQTSGSPLVPIYCRAADAAAGNVNLSVEWFGY